MNVQPEAVKSDVQGVLSRLSKVTGPGREPDKVYISQDVDRALNEAEKQAAQIKTKAASDIEMEKKKAINDAKNEISDLAMAIAGKVVGRELNDADQDGMIDRFIEELGDQK